MPERSFVDPPPAKHGRTLWAPLAAYAGTFALAQFLVAAGEVLLGTIVAATLVLVLSTHSVYSYHRGERAAGDVFACLALVPALVLVRHVLDVGPGAPTTQHVVWTIAVALAAVTAVAALAGTTQGFQIATGNWRAGAAVMLQGPVFGLAAYSAARPTADAVSTLMTPVAGVLIAVAVAAEEILFRGVLQRTLAGAAGRLGVGVTILFFALAYLDVTPTNYALAVAAAGALLSLAVSAGAPVVAAAGARVLLTISALSLWPHVLG